MGVNYEGTLSGRRWETKARQGGHKIQSYTPPNPNGLPTLDPKGDATLDPTLDAARDACALCSPIAPSPRDNASGDVGVEFTCACTFGLKVADVGDVG
jgi:hypothetical protein